MLRMMWCRQHNLIFSSDHQDSDDQDIERVVHSMSNNSPASQSGFLESCVIQSTFPSSWSVLPLFHWRCFTDVPVQGNERKTLETQEMKGRPKWRKEYSEQGFLSHARHSLCVTLPWERRSSMKSCPLTQNWRSTWLIVEKEHEMEEDTNVWKKAW